MRIWFKQLRESHGLSQKALACQIGVSRTIVQLWEAGQNPTDDNKVALARVLGPEVLDGFSAELKAQAAGGAA
jgi:transcriptional regulator with XRE-family HTH domain